MCNACRRLHFLSLVRPKVDTALFQTKQSFEFGSDDDADISPGDGPRFAIFSNMLYFSSCAFSISSSAMKVKVKVTKEKLKRSNGQREDVEVSAKEDKLRSNTLLRDPLILTCIYSSPVLKAKAASGNGKSTPKRHRQELVKKTRDSETEDLLPAP